MGATADNFDGTKIILGPGKLYADVAVPSAGARMTLDSGGTPDSTANPLAKHLGLTAAGAVVELGLNVQDFESDELTSPHLSRIITSPVSIKAELLQIADFTDVMKYVTPQATYATASGYKQLSLGGQSAITTYSFALIAPTVADPTKMLVVHLYKAYNKAPFSFNVTRKEQAKAQIELVGLAIATRAVNDQVGNLWQQIA
ncbi:MAG: hypothetical protein E6R03_02205 [Hyphomicrobiaceae bacterium]|nr:MAG: hypothetical protein E6R03_02205 [Hyphomicrobiaceae bacterium]